MQATYNIKVGTLELHNTSHPNHNAKVLSWMPVQVIQIFDLGLAALVIIYLSNQMLNFVLHIYRTLKLTIILILLSNTRQSMQNYRVLLTPGSYYLLLVMLFNPYSLPIVSDILSIYHLISLCNFVMLQYTYLTYCQHIVVYLLRRGRATQTMVELLDGGCTILTDGGQWLSYLDGQRSTYSSGG